MILENRTLNAAVIWLLAMIAVFICGPCQGRIVEKIETVCNGPCGRLTALCPKGHRVAIRDAVYRVQEKTANCTAFPGCDDVTQDVCCEPTPKDCVFPYSPTHLKALLRNCSGNSNCLIQTERSDVESVACSTSDPENLSSQTALNYVCVNDNVIVNICSQTESVVHGKTLFAMLNSRGVRAPPKGSVCTCLAESTQWPTTNSIAVFVVDMRLNSLMSRDCAHTSLALRSGSNVKQLDCDTSRDPRVNFPFVAVLNDSNVATLRLEINHHLPEFLWFGFEANEEEDIRLSCKLQGFLSNQPSTPGSNGQGFPGRKVPPTTKVVDTVTVAEEPTNHVDKEDSKEEDKAEPTKQSKGGKVNMGLLVGGLAAGLLVILLVAVTVTVLLIRWRHKQEACESCDLTGPDTEVYYSTTDDEEIRNLAASKANTEANSQNVYTTADKVEVKIRKKTSSKKVRIVSTPEFLEDNGEDYVSALEVRERKRMSEKHDLEQCHTYDHLTTDADRHQDLALDGYDQLHQNQDKPPSYSSVSGIEVEGQGDPFRPADSDYKTGDSGRVNQAYEDTGVGGVNDDARSGGDAQPGLYFELERRFSDGDSLSYEDHYFVKSQQGGGGGKERSRLQSQSRDATHAGESDDDVTSADGSKLPVTAAQPSLTYTDAVSAMSIDDQKRESPKRVTGTTTTTTTNDNDDHSKRRQSVPLPAPRRSVPKQTRASQYDVTEEASRASQYDIAKPIP